MGEIHVDDMSVEQVCTNLRDFRSSVQNVFEKIGLMVALYGTDPC